MPNNYKRKTDGACHVRKFSNSHTKSRWIVSLVLLRRLSIQPVITGCVQMLVRLWAYNDIPSIVKTAFDVAITAKNINAEFHATETIIDTLEIPTPENQRSLISSCVLTANIEPVASTSQTIPVVFSPEEIRPLPKAPPRKVNQPKRRKVKSAVLTDTPVKDEIAIEAMKAVNKSFASSKSKEKWVQCIDCKGWSHEACTEGELQYICHNCLSDSD
ncbi:hypothetical protein ACJJTC_008043 [Scirpophaga incertulas]